MNCETSLITIAEPLVIYIILFIFGILLLYSGFRLNNKLENLKLELATYKR
jgi:uncharacterized membrane protein